MREKPMFEQMNDWSHRSGSSTIEPDDIVVRDLHALDDGVIAQRYELGAVLGRGAKGVVYRGRDRVLRRDVAIKLLYPDVADEDEAAARFRQEARLGARVNHPNAVAIFDTGVHDGQPFIVMECLTGETLAARIAMRPLPPRQVRAIGAQLLRALDAAHRHGIIHRDIKPANVLFTSTGKVKVADFGIATTTDGPRVTGTGLVLGTLAYLAPERLQGAPATPKSDIYAAGVVLYEALTGRKPFEADSPAELLDQISSSSFGQIAVPSDAGSKLMRIVIRAIQEDPSLRYATAEAMARALERAPIAEPRSSLPPPPPPATIVTPAVVTGHRPRRRSVMLASMAFVATVGGVGAFVAHDGAFSDPTTPTSPPSTAAAATVVDVVPLVSTTVVTTTVPPTTAQPATTVATTTVSSTTRATSTTVRSTTTRPATTTTAATTRSSRGKGKERDD